MSDELEIQRGVTIPAWELWWTASRSGGPGGQHANKTSSRVTLHWSLTQSSALTPSMKARALRKLRSRLTAQGELLVSVDTTRSQHQNRELARERLAQIIRDALKVAKRRVATKPTKGSQRRRVDAKKARGDTKKMRKKPSMD
jgi:ribosome-associated protein